MILANALLIGSLIVPQTSYDTLAVEPLRRGESAYIDDGYGRALMFVGRDAGEALNVTDQQTIHGYKVEAVNRDDMVVSAPGLVYDGVNDEWTAASVPSGTVYTVTVSCPANIKPDRITFNCSYESLGVGSFTPIQTIDYRDNVVVITLECRWAGQLFKFKNLAGQYTKFGSKEEINDLRTVRFNFIDDLGKWNLGNLRHWVTHLYDGNRGEDWYKYRALGNVCMDKHAIMFGNRSQLSNDCYTVYADAHRPDTFVIGKGGVDQIVIGRGGSPYYAEPGAAMRITSFRTVVDGQRSTVQILVAVTNITGFTTDNLKLVWTERLDHDLSVWRDIPYELGTSAVPGTYTLEADAGDMSGFYFLRYDTTYAAVDVKGTINAREITVGGTNLIALATNAVNAVANQSVTAAVDAQLQEILGPNWRTTYGGGLAGLIAALVAALAWLKANKVGSFAAVGGQTPTVSSGVADLSSLFTGENTSLVAAVNATIAARCASLDPNESSISDVINALKGTN